MCEWTFRKGIIANQCHRRRNYFQIEKALLPIDVTEDGISNLFIAVQFSKELSLIDFTEDEISALFNVVQFSNAPSPIDFTEEGINTSFNSLQFEKMPFSIDVTWPCIATFSIDTHTANDLGPIEITEFEIAISVKYVHWPKELYCYFSYFFKRRSELYFFKRWTAKEGKRFNRFIWWRNCYLLEWYACIKWIWPNYSYWW